MASVHRRLVLTLGHYRLPGPTLAHLMRSAGFAEGGSEAVEQLEQGAKQTMLNLDEPVATQTAFEVKSFQRQPRPEACLADVDAWET